MGDVLEYIIERHHFHTFARRGIDIFVDGDKGNAERRIYDFRKATTLNMLTTKTGKVFYDDCTDFTFFNHTLHTVKIATVKTCTRNAVIHEKHRIGISVFFSVVRKNLLLVADTVRFVYIPSLIVLIILYIFNRKATIEGGNQIVVYILSFNIVCSCHFIISFPTTGHCKKGIYILQCPIAFFQCASITIAARTISVP